MDQVFDGQVALVTGGGKGIGFGIALALAQRGARVAITGRDMDALDAAISRLPGSVRAVPMDVREERSVQMGVKAIATWGGRIDMLVNNAGIGLLDTPLVDTSLEAWRNVIETNLTGLFAVTRAAWPHLVESKGQVLNVSSIAGTQGFVGASAYCASKFGVSGFTEVLKKEGAPLGIRALTICPAAVDTDIWEEEWASDDVRSRMMSPDQIGRLAAEMLATPRNIDLAPWVVQNSVSPWQE